MPSENLAITWRRIPERYRLTGSACENCKTNYFPTRKLCPKCREAYRPDPQMLAKANLPAHIESFYRPPAQMPVLFITKLAR